MLSVKELQEQLAATPARQLETEQLPIEQIQGRLLAHDIYASLDVPSNHNSAMDGYAVNRESLALNHYTLPVSQRIAAGDKPLPLEENTCARIFTGAPIPANADAVIIQENVETRTIEEAYTQHGDTPHANIANDGSTANPSTLAAFQHGIVPEHFDNIRPQGQDIQIGQALAYAGDKVTAALNGLLASQGYGEVTVKRKLKVALISTGNEIIQPGQPLESGQLYNSNRYTVASLLQAWAPCETSFHHIPDSLQATQDTLLACAKTHDLVITFGGVSVGEEDYIKAAVSHIGQLDHWKVKLKPGKPLMKGTVHHDQGETFILGLPGNPVSAFVTFLLFGKSLLAALAGQPHKPVSALPLPIGFDITKPRKRPEYIRANVEQGQIVRAGNQSSGVLSSLHEAYCLALIPSDQTLKTGDHVDCYPLNDLIHG